MKRISVLGTGLTGLVGSRVVELTRDVFNWHYLSRAAGVDITNKDHVQRAASGSEGDILIHFAAFTDLTVAEKEKGDKTGLCYQLNVLGTRYIANACAENAKHLIYISTDAVFAGNKQTPYVESQEPNPINWYGQTKWFGEQEVINSGCQSTIVRIAYPFRSRFERREDFVRKLSIKLAKGESVNMFTDTLFTPTFIDDIASAMKTVVARRPTGVFHVVGSSILSPYNAASAIAEAFGYSSKLINRWKLDKYLKMNPRSYPRWAGLSNQKAKKVLGITMLNFDQALKVIKQQITPTR